MLNAIHLSFLAGFYGMIFIYMSEFSNPFAYPVLIVVMIIIASAMLIFFKRKNGFKKVVNDFFTN